MKLFNLCISTVFLLPSFTTSCSDSTSYLFETVKDGFIRERKCGWLTADPSLAEDRLNKFCKTESHGSWVEEECADSCNSCDTGSPSMSPSDKVSSSPSAALSSSPSAKTQTSSSPTVGATTKPLSINRVVDETVNMEDYIAPEYKPIGPISSFHSVPRFGRPSTITSWLGDDGTIDMNKVTDYIMGSIFVAAFMFSTYLVFVLTVVAFKLCCGYDAGILAGYPFIEDKSLIFERPRKNNYFRGFLLFMTFNIILGGFLFLVKGTQQVGAVISDVRDGTDGFATVSQRIVDTADEMIQFGESTITLRNNLVDMIDEGICNSFETGNQNPIEEFDNAASSLVNVLTEMQNFAKNDLTDIRDIFATDIISIGRQMANTTDSTEIMANPAYYAAPTIALGFLLFVGLMLSWLEIFVPGYFCVQVWVMLPFLFILITLSIVMITVVGAFLVTNSDFCIGSPEGTPEGTIKPLFEIFDFDNRTMAALNYYIIDGCSGEYEQLTAVEDLILQLGEGYRVAKELDELIDSNKADFENMCGGGAGSLDPLQETMGLALDAFDDIIGIGNSTTRALSCYDVNSIWIDIMHDAVCTSAPSALTWMFSSIMLVYISGIFIFLLRGALLPSLDMDGAYDDDSEYTDDDDDAYR